MCAAYCINYCLYLTIKLITCHFLLVYGKAFCGKFGIIRLEILHNIAHSNSNYRQRVLCGWCGFSVWGLIKKGSSSFNFLFVENKRIYFYLKVKWAAIILNIEIYIISYL